MRYLLLACALLFSPPAMAQQTYNPISPTLRPEMRGIIYNMCRGGGYAYELEPQYADDLDAGCLKETESLIAEYPQRAAQTKLEIDAHLQRAKTAQTRPSDAELTKAMNSILGRVNYLDYCHVKESERINAPADNPNCAYIDARFVNDPWSVIMEGSSDDMTKIFHDLVQLPAPLQDVRDYLQRSGFNCDKPYECSIPVPVLNEQTTLMGHVAKTEYIYKFGVTNGMIVETQSIIKELPLP